MNASTLGVQQPGVAPRVARFRYTKLGKIRFTSHRDVGRMWERALRKVALAVAYTSGFSPRPRIAFGFALPTGAESLAEYVDIGLALDRSHELSDIPSRLTPALPEGLEVTGGVIMDAGSPALQAAVTCSTWELNPISLAAGRPSPAAPDRGAPPTLAMLAERLDQFMSSRTFEIEVERKGTSVPTDIRPGVLAAALNDDGVITCDLSAKGTRPGDFLRALGADPLEARILRTQQWIDHQGGRAEPLAPGAYFAPPGLTEIFREEPIDVRSEPVPAFAAAPPPARHAGRT
ncbi:MAG TPA: TIGR03936 family radical SAM-associated protein [Acidimicrobiales bacterium]|nr:TIGR03936 family radical SAM-associated protein [Acidimicrobiales bacterium]